MAGYEHRVVAFLDVLGWKSFVQQSVADASLFHAMEEALALVPNEQFFYQRGYGTDLMELPSMTQFSDSIVLSAALGDGDAKAQVQVLQIFLWVQAICHLMLSRGFPVRGGVTDGLMYHHDNRAFGPALNEAIALEANYALYPRVVIPPRENGAIFSPATTALLRPLPRDYSRAGSTFQHRAFSSFLRPDSDGVSFIDFLPGNVRSPGMMDQTVRVRDSINKGLSVYSGQPSVHLKYAWLKKYFDASLGDIRLG